MPLGFDDGDQLVGGAFVVVGLAVRVDGLEIVEAVGDGLGAAVEVTSGFAGGLELITEFCRNGRGDPVLLLGLRPTRFEVAGGVVAGLGLDFAGVDIDGPTVVAARCGRRRRGRG